MMRRRDVLAGALAGGAMRPASAGAATVVLELFTSQGCSSCPPADALLGKLAREQGIIALAWHVDYWNSASWHDPYSSAFATRRQQRYAARLGEEVYTPALVVDGARMVVGSDGPAILQAISGVEDFAVRIGLTDGAAEIGAVGEPVSAVLVTYVPQQITRIGGGENGGRRLTEYHIVRAAVALGSWDGGARRLGLPAITAGHGAALLVQDADLRVRGAAMVRAG
jgi:hypothetical protein